MTHTPREDRSSDREEILVVGPPGVQIRVMSGGDYSMYHFASLAELEAWIVRRATTRGMSAIVDRCSHDLGFTLDDLPPDLRRVLDWLRTRDRTPCLKDLEEREGSRRTFFRHWKKSISESPAKFLRRLRTRHAEALIASGMRRRDAVKRAGFRTVGEFSRKSNSFGTK